MEQNTISTEKVENVLNKIEQLIRNNCWIIELRHANRLFYESLRAGPWLFADWLICNSRRECRYSRGAIIRVTRSGSEISWDPVMYGEALEIPLSFALRYDGELWYIAEYERDYDERSFTEYKGIYDAKPNTLRYIMRTAASMREVLETVYYCDGCDETQVYFWLYEAIKDVKIGLRFEWNDDTATITPFVIDGEFIPIEKILEKGKKTCVLDLQQL